MSKIETLVKDNEHIYPRTVEKAIYDDNGVRLDNKIKTLTTKEDITRLESDLNTALYSDIAGGKNLFDYNGIIPLGFRIDGNKLYNTITDSVTEFNYTFRRYKEPNIYSVFEDINTTFIYDSSWPYIQIKHNGARQDIIMFYDVRNLTHGETYTIHFYVISDNPSVIDGLVIGNIQIEKGAGATPYEPYIQSNKMLGHLSNETLDIKMLGWSVPQQLGVNNYMDANRKMHRRVGRVDLGSLNWGYMDGVFFASVPNIPLFNSTMYCLKYHCVKTQPEFVDKTAWNAFMYTQYSVNFKDSNYSDAESFKNANKGVYLYYELAEEIVMDVDGNEIATELKSAILAPNTITTSMVPVVLGYSNRLMLLIYYTVPSNAILVLDEIALYGGSDHNVENKPDLSEFGVERRDTHILFFEKTLSNVKYKSYAGSIAEVKWHYTL